LSLGSGGKINGCVELWNRSKLIKEKGKLKDKDIEQTQKPKIYT
jgi:hypothetical protein